MACAAGPRTLPRASTGYGVGGGSSRIRGRGGSGLTGSALSIVSRMNSAPSGIIVLLAARGGVFGQKVVEIAIRSRRHRDPHGPALGGPPLRGIPRGFLAAKIAV